MSFRGRMQVDLCDLEKLGQTYTSCVDFCTEKCKGTCGYFQQKQREIAEEPQKLYKQRPLNLYVQKE